ncbi:MAG: hypothetical protein M3Y53_00815 [Thermoproteota archaeon]|nr:hypothetical protein [Thermoproteota archaeon]
MHTNEIFRKFHESREYRKQVMHHGKKLDKSNPETNINNIFCVHRYLIENASAFIGNVLKLAEKTKP